MEHGQQEKLQACDRPSTLPNEIISHVTACLDPVESICGWHWHPPRNISVLVGSGPAEFGVGQPRGRTFEFTLDGETWEFKAFGTWLV